MKLSNLLSISQLSLKTEEKLVLAYSHPSPAELASLGASPRKTERMLSFLAKTGVKVVFYGMELYPKPFYQLENPPFRLMYTNQLPQDTEQVLSVCGTRYCDGLACQRAYEFGLEAGANGTLLVVSNSRGIDRSTLYALNDSKQRALVVCDCGLAVKRITENALLASFCLVSPYEPDDEALPFRCLSRNVLSTALGEATVVVQAPLKSGALHCATCALDVGRDVYVHRVGTRPGNLNAGSRSLEEMGCECVDGYAGIASLRGWPVQMRIQAGSLYRYGSSCYSLCHA